MATTLTPALPHAATAVMGTLGDAVAYGPSHPAMVSSWTAVLVTSEVVASGRYPAGGGAASRPMPGPILWPREGPRRTPIAAAGMTAIDAANAPLNGPHRRPDRRRLPADLAAGQSPPQS